MSTESTKTTKLDERSRLLLDLQQLTVTIRRLEDSLVDAHSKYRAILAQLDRAKITR